jgi:DNA-binding PadR family transcriptional regulator
MHHSHPRHEYGGRREFARSRGYGYGRSRGGPRARRGDIRAAALALLAERPMHGYEMIKEIEERTDGAWTPSAGSIYPTLQMLEDEGLISGQEIEGKRRFTLTDSGRAEQESRAGEQTPWDAVRAGSDPELAQLRESAAKLHHAIAQVFHAADESQRRRARELLDETRRKVYAILAEED